MKFLLYVLACMSVCSFSSCSSQSKDEKRERLLLLMEDSIKASGPQRMQVSEVKATFKYQGKEYQSFVQRRPDENLPMVKNEQGETFVDNCITLQLTSGGKQLVNKVFTKESFASLIDVRFMKHAILEGLVYDQTTPQGIIYAASVCYPQSDLYVPIKLTITAAGNISVARDELLDDYQTDSIG